MHVGTLSLHLQNLLMLNRHTAGQTDGHTRRQTNKLTCRQKDNDSPAIGGPQIFPMPWKKMTKPTAVVICLDGTNSETTVARWLCEPPSNIPEIEQSNFIVIT